MGTLSGTGAKLSASLPLIEWACATRALEGETESGDLYVVKPFSGGVLVGVADGLGHGVEAVAAAEQAVAILGEYAQESVISLVERCHAGLRKTRGVVMSLASISAQGGTMTWVGVGNVEAVLLRADARANPPRENVLHRGGVVGYELPFLRASRLSLSRGDTLVFFTDGIRTPCSDGLPLGEPPQRIADHILACYAKRTDDALVLVVRYLGGEK